MIEVTFFIIADLCGLYVFVGRDTHVFVLWLEVWRGEEREELTLTSRHEHADRCPCRVNSVRGKEIEHSRDCGAFAGNVRAVLLEGYLIKHTPKELKIERYDEISVLVGVCLHACNYTPKNLVLEESPRVSY